MFKLNVEASIIMVSVCVMSCIFIRKISRDVTPV